MPDARWFGRTALAVLLAPTLLPHGERDTIDTIGQSMIYLQGLKNRGVPVRFIRFPLRAARVPRATPSATPRHRRNRLAHEVRAWHRLEGARAQGCRHERGQEND
jgi:dipeptidyl aminopeptidase/acylaminoacyl peptidase